MSAAEMRESAARWHEEMAPQFSEGSAVRWAHEDAAIAIRALPLPDEEGMVERVVEALREARLTRPSISSRCVRMTDEAIAACVGDDLRDDARAAIRAINGGEP